MCNVKWSYCSHLQYICVQGSWSSTDTCRWPATDCYGQWLDQGQAQKGRAAYTHNRKHTPSGKTYAFTGTAAPSRKDTQLPKHPSSLHLELPVPEFLYSEPPSACHSLNDLDQDFKLNGLNGDIGLSSNFLCVPGSLQEVKWKLFNFQNSIHSFFIEGSISVPDKICYSRVCLIFSKQSFVENDI